VLPQTAKEEQQMMRKLYMQSVLKQSNAAPKLVQLGSKNDKNEGTGAVTTSNLDARQKRNSLNKLSRMAVEGDFDSHFSWITDWGGSRTAPTFRVISMGLVIVSTYRDYLRRV
jgi:hypothetical protein